MTQYVINIGSLPNDGTGDPLRTAFNETNLNFDQVFAAGPVLSNVRIANNTILTTNTNGNLVLAPNGVGRIQANATVVPSVANVRDLGSTDRRWNTVYAQYFDVSGQVSVNDLTVDGNLTVVGNTIQIGNITTETKTIQLANAASTANAANGSGVTVGANDDIATILYNSTTNTWNMNIGVSAVGNITAPYFIGNGALLTGIVTSSYANANAVAYGQAGWAGNIIPATSNTYSLGNATNQWSDLYVSNATIYMNNVPISLTAGNVLTVDGEDVVVTTANGTVNLGNLTVDNNNIFNAQGQGVVISNFSFIDEAETAYVQIPAGNTASDLSIVQKQGNVRIAANAVSWTFDTTGNITLPTGTPSINYANGAPYGGGTGTGGIVFEYDIANYTANITPAVGTMQFTNRLGEVVLPDAGTRLFINATDGTGINTGSTWLAMAENSERGTLTLQQDGAQTPYRVTNIGVYNTPEVYRGYRAGVNQIWGDDPSINQIIISNAASPVFYNPDFDLEDDIFHATNLADATAVYMVNVYGSDDFTPLSQDELWNFFTSFVDNVIYQGTDTETQDVAQIRNAFYTNFGNFYGSINSTKYDSEFRFASGTTYYSSAPATGGSGDEATLRVRLNANYTYTVMGISAPGFDYAADDTITIPGDQLNGTTPANDLVVTVNTVNGSGGITGVTLVSGVAAFPWRSNNISDGGDDQYDTGNYINTNLAQEILYQGGNVTAGTTQFGTDSEYAVMYNSSIFCMAATDVDITDLYYSGNLGADSDGFLRWSGLRNPGSAISVEYAYMQCDQGTGSLEPLPGETYQVALDSGGINLDQFYSYYNDAVNSWYFGADQDWRLESKQTLDVQSYNTLTLQTLIPNEPTGLNSPEIIIRTDTGSDGNASVNLQAGSGGPITIQAGDAGTNNGVPTLGNNGGPISIIAGDATGNGFAGGGVLVAAGQGAAGSAGNLTLRTRDGVTANGAVVIETNNPDAQKFWTFDAAGNLTLPVNGNIVSADNENARFQATDNGLVRSSITLGPNDGIVKLESYSSQSNQGFTTADWATGVFTNESGFGSISFTDAPNIINFLNTIDQSRLFFQVNSGVEMRSDGWSQGGNNITFYTFIPPASSPENVTDFSISYSDRSFIEMDYDEGELNIQARDLNVNIRSDLDVDILAEDVIRLENNSVNNPIYIVTDAANTNQTWAFTSTGALVLPGDANIAGGNLNGGTASASVALNAFAPDGNTVTIQAQGNTSSAVISVLDYAGPNTYTWSFNSAGNLTLPLGGTISEGPSPSYLGDAVTITPANGNDANQQLKIYPTIAEGNHLHLTSGNLQVTDIFLGDDNQYIRTGNTGGMVIGTDGGEVFGGYAWTFGADGVITLPNGGQVDNSDNNIELRSTNNINFETANVVNIYTNDGNYQWQFGDNGALILAPITTGEGTGESASIQGSRTVVGGFDNALPYVVELPGHTEFGNVVWTASTGSIQSAKITFVVQSGGSAFQWEQFDVSVCKFDGANAFVTVSNRIKQNSSVADTQVEAYDGEGGLEVWLNPADGQTIAWVNYQAVEFGLMVD